MIKALIFDVDGTLAETEEAHRQAFNEIFARAGLGWFWDRGEYRRLLAIAGGKERMRYFRDRQGDISLSDSDIATMHLRKTQRYNEILLEGGVGLRPGVTDLVELAQTQGVRLAVSTTTSRVNVDALCQAEWGVAADRIFEVIASGDEVLRKKPDPSVYLLALDRLGLRGTDAVAIEDSTIGLAAARAAGVVCVVAPSAYTSGDDFAGATWQVETLLDWRDSFEQLCAGLG